MRSTNTGLILDLNFPKNFDIEPLSAIVCFADERGDPVLDEDGMIDVWFEGNLFGSENLSSFIQKARCAAGRMTTNYPTVAKARIAANEIGVLAKMDLDRGIITEICNEEDLILQSLTSIEDLFAGTEIVDRNPEEMGTMLERHDGRLLTQSPHIYQFGNGYLAIQKEKGGEILLLHPESQKLADCCKDLPDDMRLRVMGAAAIEKDGETPKPAGF